MTRLPRSRVWLPGLACVLAGALPVLAQRVVPRNAPRPAEAVPAVVSIVPPGVTIGESIDWTVGGRNLARVERFLISGDGVEVVEIKNKANGSVVATVRAAPDATPGFREVHAESSDGLSNLMVVRVDSLRQTAETEPNDDPAHANDVPRGTAVFGVLKPQDLDHFRLKAGAGERLAIEVEAQRLGSPIVPVVTVLGPTGRALAQGRQSRGEEHDCRMTFTVPHDGSYIVQVRDNTYGGGEQAVYRLRVETAPFATGLFPLGGPPGESITVTASGGNLKEPRSKTFALPNTPGALIDPGPIDGPGGAVLAPARLAVGEGPEVFETTEGGPSRAATPLFIKRRADGGPARVTANGRIDRPGEVDRYSLRVKKEDRLRVKVQARSLGSWIDSVVTVRDARGNQKAENDDQGGTQNSGAGVFGVTGISPDSLLDYVVEKDGEIVVEIADRFGGGGPEYAYRLTVGAVVPDFEMRLLLSNPAANRQALGNARRTVAGGPGATGALNLKPGSTTPINFQIAPTGRPGPVVVRAEGLPAEVSADPVTIRLPGGMANRGSATVNAPPSSGALVLRVAANAHPALGELRVVGTIKREDGTTLSREAIASLSLEPALSGSQAPPPVRQVSRIPVKVVGVPQPTASPRNEDRSGPVALKQITAPGVLLQGGWLDLALEVEPAGARSDRFDVKAEAKGKGLSIADSGATPSVAGETGATVRVVATVDAEPGVQTVTVRFRPARGEAVERAVAVIVRPPIRISPRPEPIELAPGGSAALWVGVVREPGYHGPVELRASGLAAGVKAVGRFVIQADQDGGVVRMTCDKRSKPIERPFAVRIVGVARMPKGPVPVDSTIRPMVGGRPAEE